MIKLLNVLGVGLLMAVITPLWAQNVEIESEIYASESDGTWYAAGYTQILNDPACDYCGDPLNVTTTAKENGQDIATVSGSGVNDYAHDEYDSPPGVIVDLSSRYTSWSRHNWSDYFGVNNENYTEADIDIPGVPSISLNGVDASSPPFATRFVTHSC
jgi:hypothetical protein